MGRAAPNGEAFESDEALFSAGASDTVRFARLSLGLCAGAEGAEGEVGVLASGEAAGDSGFILALHWLSMSAAVGTLSGLGGLSPDWEPRAAAPSPH